MAMMITSLWEFCVLSLLLSYVVELEASHHVYSNIQTSELTSTRHQTKEPYRTGYHFQPPKNWINDPNVDLMRTSTIARTQLWKMDAAHSTSTYLLNWTPHDDAIYPSQLFDINGCWSGSATILSGGKPAIFYTGINPQNKQAQNLAFPKNLSDPFLKEWVKIPQNPLMKATRANHINATSFRDPTTAWLGSDNRWRLIGGSQKNQTGSAILYRSKDFLNWTKVNHPLHSAKKTGMWECPDFFSSFKE
ncbi:putative beta-fructofuranosidase [Rosa chinensis]|uniref:Putative beta-fructofuranosidase n=1 Tax=Rosa chinensis TaxID=74649 RepID=A0A2P6RY65_ROSCH|nr:putative beta-fructofuranosidase [Rosa chinensis]